METLTHFCTCKDLSCALHPTNHEKGCDPCIKKNLEAGEIPSCFFRAVDSDLSRVKDFKTKDFVDFYLQKNKK